MNAALTGKPAPPAGWTIFTTVLIASSGWANVLLWVITGRQYGFSAASVRTMSDEEDNIVGTYALKPHANVSSITPGDGYAHLRVPSADQTPTRPQHSTFTSVTSDGGLLAHPADIPRSSVYDTPASYSYDTGVYQPEAYTGYEDERR